MTPLFANDIFCLASLGLPARFELTDVGLFEDALKKVRVQSFSLII
jgi:hypothetical protein